MSTKSLITYSLLALIGITMLLGVVYISSQPVKSLAGTQIPDLGMATTSTSISVTSSARILATSTNPLDPTNSYERMGAVICNTGTNPVYILASQDRPTRFAVTGTNSGVTAVIAAAAGYNVCWSFTRETFPYNGSITASSTNQTATVITVLDYVR